MSDDVEEGAKGFLSSALLVAAVAAVLLAGLLLKSDPDARSTRAAATPAPEPSLALGSTIAPETSPSTAPTADPAQPDPLPPPAAEEPLPGPAAVEATAKTAPAPMPAPARAKAEPRAEPKEDPLVLKLATRADHDRARLSKSQGRWTAQLLLACRPENVERLLTAGAGSPKLYVLPAHVKDDACFRICFGTYASSKEAAAAADLPKALRGKDKIAAVEVSKVLL